MGTVVVQEWVCMMARRKGEKTGFSCCDHPGHGEVSGRVGAGSLRSGKDVRRLGVVCVAGIMFYLVAMGCGYHRAGTNNPQLDGISSIAIPYFKNKTFEPEAERIFTHAFVNEFIKSRRLQVVSEPEADLVLRGTLKKIIEDTIAYNRDDKALEYRMDVVLDIQLERRVTGEVLWKRKNMRHSEEFPVGVDIVLSEAAKRAALERLAADLAERIHDSIIQGF